MSNWMDWTPATLFGFYYLGGGVGVGVFVSWTQSGSSHMVWHWSKWNVDLALLSLSDLGIVAYKGLYVEKKIIKKTEKPYSINIYKRPNSSSTLCPINLRSWATNSRLVRELLEFRVLLLQRLDMNIWGSGIWGKIPVYEVVAAALATVDFSQFWVQLL